MFRGIVIDKVDDNYQAELTSISEDMLMDGDVSIDVMYSTLNYKDGLAITGKSPVVRRFPMIPGVDLVGTVTQSGSSRFLIKLPEGMSPRHAMAIGTAGYTAMLCVMALQKHGIEPGSGEVLVTGANGGVGSFAVALLAKLGYTVVASTGRMEEADYLKKLGASEIIHRDTLSEPGRPLTKERWAAAIDSVGSHTLANVCASTCYGGIVAACGLAQGYDLPATVMPFILRGVTLAGIDSVMRPLEDREVAWSKLAELVDDDLLAEISHEIGLGEVIETGKQLLEGKVRGRVVVNLSR